jgi:mannitol/fructose-specific phosphotransferase system IIA component (Ntr-type)
MLLWLLNGKKKAEMRLIEILSKKSIKLNVSVESKNDLLEELLFLVSLGGKVRDFNLAKTSVYDREKIMVTGIGKGVALPHSKSDGVTAATASLITLSKPVDYDSFDNIPVNIALMILSPNENPEIHLSLIGKLARFFQNESNRKKILTARNSEEVLNLF